MTTRSLAYLLAFVGVIGISGVAADAFAQPGTGEKLKIKKDKDDDKDAKKKKEEAKSGPVKVGDKAPDFELKDADGKSVRLSDLRGKVVVLDVWATWCPPCREGMPSIQKISEEFKGKEVAVYGLNAQGRTAGDAVKFMKDNKYTYGLLLKADGVHEKFGGGGIPQLWVIGPDGIVLEHEVGFNKNQRSEFESHLRDVINKGLQTAGKDVKKDANKDADKDTNKDKKDSKDSNKDSKRDSSKENKKDANKDREEKRTDAPAPAKPGAPK